MTTPELFDILAKKYPSPAYSFLGNVRNQTGYANGNSIRTADALAMSLWPSRGLHLTGFELKISRSDWLHELKQPEKAEEIAKYCHYWYLIIADESYVQLLELPTTWGMMAIVGKKLKIIKEAPFNKDAELITPWFFASLMRNIQESYIAKQDIKSEISKAEKRYQIEYERKSKYTIENYNKLFDSVKEFEKISGVQIGGWDNKKIAEAVKMVLDSKHLDIKEDLEKIQKKIGNILAGKNIYD